MRKMDRIEIKFLNNIKKKKGSLLWKKDSNP